MPPPGARAPGALLAQHGEDPVLHTEVSLWLLSSSLRGTAGWCTGRDPRGRGWSRVGSVGPTLLYACLALTPALQGTHF